MKEWYEQGLATKEIARRLGVTTRTIEHWLKKGMPYGKAPRKRKSGCDRYAGAAIALWQNAATSSLQVWPALQDQGFQGS
jgi:IS30 family transposase